MSSALLADPLPSPEAVFAPLADRPGAVWLDGGDDEPWSILAWDPEEVVTDPEGWDRAGRRLTSRTVGDAALPFVGGVIGYVGYGAGPAVAPVAPSLPAWEPDVWLGRYAGGLLHHRPTGRWIPVGPERVRREGLRFLEAARDLGPPAPAAPRPATTSLPELAFRRAVERALAWIGEGDCYQLNLTRAVQVEDAGDPWEAWRRIRATSRPGRGAYLVLDERLRVLSNSPERLLDVTGDVAVTVPIKGTRPRSSDPVQDARWAAELEASEKDRAELVMIVDLCRNDLGRVAVPGTVAAGPRTVKAHANVHHASVEVRAQLRPGEDAWSALAALFPPGSVTGAPKVRATWRIAELEPVPRGVYCGAIGHVSGHGRSGWSVAIRTAVFEGHRARWHVGGGIVADSDPAAEWRETVAKGRVLATAMGALKS